jgi:hypothetical protein
LSPVLGGAFGHFRVPEILPTSLALVLKADCPCGHDFHVLTLQFDRRSWLSGLLDWNVDNIVLSAVVPFIDEFKYFHGYGEQSDLF